MESKSVVKKLGYKFFLILFSVLLQGCPKGVEIVLCNNSNQNLHILINDQKRVEWRQGVTLVFGSDELWVKDGDQYYPQLLLEMENDVLEYKLFSIAELPEDYAGYSVKRGFLVEINVYTFQLESNLSLYVVKPGGPLPSDVYFPTAIKPLAIKG